MDRVTEEIAHFIGLFEVNIEEARQREAYREFHTEESDLPADLGLPHFSSSVSAPYQLNGFEPGLSYRAPTPPEFFNRALPFVDYDPLQTSPGHPNALEPKGYLPSALLTAGSLTLPEVETIGSVATYINQGIRLSDNDYFGVGGHGLFFAAESLDDGMLTQLADRAADLSPIDDLEMTGSADGIIDFVTTATERLADYSGEVNEDSDVSVQKAETIEDIFVNGEKVEEAPNIEDYHTLGKEDEGAKEEEEHHEEGYTAVPSSYHAVENGLAPSVTVETGGNQLVNDAVLKNMWTAAPVTAVAGAHFELNAIIQINAWCDTDAVTSALDGWWNGHAPTEAFNIATFERHDTTADANGDPSDGFPQHWVVKEITGDLMVVNWLEQFTFMMDNDVGIVSSSGVTSRIYAGDNMAYNGVSLEEIGFGYDLIIIGGNAYDANIIHQLNVLWDNDLIGAVDGFETTGSGSISTSGNLLWNQAHIYNVGGADRFETLPSHYKAAAASLAAGGNDLSQLLTDSAFAGDGFLSVLYIRGDLINVQYAKQTNILGDSDQVALAMHSMDPFAEANWSVSTGSNALVNNASILDLDSTGKTYVGDGHYSSELLVQADIISTDPEFGGQNPDQLVNEAVAFLDDDMLGQSDETGQSPYGQVEQQDSQGDGLQTMLG